MKITNPAIIALALLWVAPAHAEVFDLGPIQCATYWSADGLHLSCDGFDEHESLADPDESIWRRTSIEAFVSDGNKRKWFCDWHGRKAPSSSYAYDPEKIYCERIDSRIETMLPWAITRIEPGVGTVLPFNLRINVITAAGRKGYQLFPSSNINDISTFGELKLTEDNRLTDTEPTTPETPSNPFIPQSMLALTWDPQDDAGWFWVYIQRDEEVLERVKVGQMLEEPHLLLDQYMTEGTSHYVFEVTAEAAELNESRRSDPHEAWIIKVVEAAKDCPDPEDCPETETCPDCPACPDPVICDECPDPDTHPLPSISTVEIRVQCEEQK